VNRVINPKTVVTVVGVIVIGLLGALALHADPNTVSAIANVLGGVGTVGTLAYVLLNREQDRAVADHARIGAKAAQDEAAGSIRPVLISDASVYANTKRRPVPDALDLLVTLDPDHSPADLLTTFAPNIVNIGNGHALRVRARLTRTCGEPFLLAAGGELKEPTTDISLLRTGEARGLGSFAHTGWADTDPYVLELFYDDLGGRSYRTVITLSGPELPEGAVVRNPTVLIKADVVEIVSEGDLTTNRTTTAKRRMTPKEPRHLREIGLAHPKTAEPRDDAGQGLEGLHRPARRPRRRRAPHEDERLSGEVQIRAV
jgi:hypothetical protein